MLFSKSRASVEFYLQQNCLVKSNAQRDWRKVVQPIFPIRELPRGWRHVTFVCNINEVLQNPSRKSNYDGWICINLVTGGSVKTTLPRALSVVVHVSMAVVAAATAVVVRDAAAAAAAVRDAAAAVVAAVVAVASCGGGGGGGGGAAWQRVFV